jgi:uncharacterized protein YdaU (DUF1376 family)
MADKTDAWMPLWIGAYLADTMNLTTLQHGAYLLLIMAYWRDRAALLDDDDTLRSITKTDKVEWKKIKPVLSRFFKIGEGVWWHKRVEEELVRAGGNKDAAGKKAAVRWDSDPQNKGRHLRSQRISEARQKGSHTPMQWEVMKQIHGHICIQCGDVGVELIKDHIQPIYQGGSDGVENIQPMCRKCNASKGPEAIDHRKEGWFDAFTEGIKRLQDACPTPSPTPIDICKLAFVAKDVCVGIPAHTQYSEEFRTAAKARPDIDDEAVWGKFNDHYQPEKRTLHRWKTWLRNEQVPKSMSAAPSVLDPDSKASVESAGMARGLGKWDETELWSVYKSRVRSGGASA